MYSPVFFMKMTRLQQQKAISKKRKQKQKGIDGGFIDKLPDDVIINILSRLSLGESARASVLARRWRYLWRSAYETLLINDKDSATRNIMESEKFDSLLNNVLEQLHQARCIQGVVISLQARRGQDPYRAVDSWVHFAMQMEVQRFELSFSHSSIFLFDTYRFPSVKWMTSHSHGLMSSCSCPFSHLRSLRLSDVDIEDEVVHYFLASCPNLEELCLNFSYREMNIRVTDPPRLRVLEISRRIVTKSTLEISAANLVSLTYRGGKNSLMLKKIPNLRDLTIRGDFRESFVIQAEEHWSFSSQLEKLVLDFRTVIRPEPRSGRLIVAPPHSLELCSLKRLEVQVCRVAAESLVYFTSLIKASPQLHEFKIELCYSAYSSPRNNGTIVFPDGTEAGGKAMNFVHRNLKVVEIGGYVGQGEEELVLALFKIGPLIDRVIIDTDEIQYFGRDYSNNSALTRDEARERAKHFVSKFPRPIECLVK